MFYLKKCLISLSLFFVCTLVFAQKLIHKPIELIQNQNTTANFMAWSSNSSHFAYIYDSTIYIRSCTSNELLQTFLVKPSDAQNIIKLVFFDNDTSLLAICNNGQLLQFVLTKTDYLTDYLTDYNTLFDLDFYTTNANTLAIDKSNFFMVEKNVIHTLLKHTNKVTSFVLDKDFSNTLYTDFSQRTQEGLNVLLTNEDAKVEIFNAANLKLLAEINLDKRALRIPVKFLKDSSKQKAIVALSGKNKLSFYNYEGNPFLELEESAGIENYDFLPSLNLIAIQTFNNELHFYNSLTGLYLGAIESYKNNKLQHFTFANNEKYVLLSYSDGSICKVNFDIKLNTSTQPEPQTVTKKEEDAKPILIEENKQKAEPYFENAEASSITSTDGTFKQKEDKSIFNKKLDKLWNTGIEARASYKHADSPFSSGFALAAQYTKISNVFPVYVGLGASFGMNFADDDFPYTYKTLDYVEFAPPDMLSFSVYLPVGVFFTLKQNPNIEFFAELLAGADITYLYKKAGSETYKTDANIYPAVGGTLGARFYSVGLFASVWYNTLIGSTWNIGASYRFSDKNKHKE